MLIFKEISLLSASILLQSFSLLCIKISTQSIDSKVFIWLFLASIFLAARAVIWQILLRLKELSEIYPYASLVQVLILLYAVAFFHENATIYNVVGLAVMLSGLYYISSGKVD